MSHYRLAPRRHSDVQPTRKMRKDPNSEYHFRPACKLCGSETKNLCSSRVHHVANRAAQDAFDRGLRPHEVTVARRVAAQNEMKRLGLVQRAVPPTWEPDPPKEQKSEYTPLEVLILEAHLRAWDHPCVQRTDDPKIKIHRTTHHVLRDNPKIRYIDYLYWIAKEMKMPVKEMKLLIGTEIQCFRPCDRLCRK